MKEILKFNEYLPLVFDFAIIFGDDISKYRIVKQVFVDDPFGIVRIGGAFLPDGAGTRRSQTVRMSAQLEPVRCAVLE